MSNKSPIDDLLPVIKDALLTALNRGIQIERKRLSRLLAGEDDPVSQETVTEPSARMARGMVRNVVNEILKPPGGLTKAEILRRAQAQGVQIAASSVANELERNDGKKGLKLYKHRGKRWYLASQALGDAPQSVAQEHKGSAASTMAAEPLMNGAAG